MKFHETTSRDITEKAGIARLTFYRNFDSKEAVIRFHIQCEFSDYMNDLSHEPSADLKKMIALCCRYREKRKENPEWLVREPFEKYPDAILNQMNLKN